MKSKDVSVTVLPWLRENLGNCLGALTPADEAALAASVHIVDLWSRSDRSAESPATMAWAICVGQMQPGVRHLAYHAVAHVADWGDRAVFWGARWPGIGPVLGPTPTSICRWEPAGPRTEVGA